VSEPRWPRLAAAALGVLWYIQLGGGASLNPLNIEWLLARDWRQHWLGFLFFQREPWTFPLGTLSSLLHPVGTNIGFTDSNPWLALLVKPFAGWLPPEFQLIGLWLAACFALQGYMGAALASVVTKDSGQQLLGGYVFVLSPVLINRLGHDTLCAHWILLGLLYLGLREYRQPAAAARAPWWAAAAVAFAAGTHPYLAAMSWALAVALAIRLALDRSLTYIRAAAAGLVATAGMFGVWTIVGYLGTVRGLSGGFGEYAANLLTFVNPDNLSRTLPALPSAPGEYEGVAFLGLGGLLAIATAAFVLLTRRPQVRLGRAVIIAVCLLLGLYAASSHIRFGRQEILNLEWLYRPVIPLIQPFRASGRFIWPLHYLLLVAGIWGVTRVFGATRAHASSALLAIVLIVQAADLRTDAAFQRTMTDPHVETTRFAMAKGHYRHLALVPMQVFGVCRDPYQEDYTYRFMLLAHRIGLTYNSGIYARLDVNAVRAACDALDNSIDSGALDPRTIYVVEAAQLPRFTAANAACTSWDGHWICVSRDSHEPFRRFIESQSSGAAGSTGSRP
jgi:hypothetical protein